MRFAGPSHPGSETVRMAPQKTTGFGLSRVRSSRKAVSSRVSVPWVITTASTAGSSRMRGDAAAQAPHPVRRDVRPRKARVVLEDELRLAAEPLHARDDLLAGEGGHGRAGAGIDPHRDRARR